MQLKKMILGGILFSLLLAGCDLQTIIDQNVDKVVLKVNDKENILPSTLTQEQVSYSGFLSGSFSLFFKIPFVFDDEEGTVSITFYLQNDKATSKERTISLFGFKKASSSTEVPPSDQINLTETQLFDAFNLVKGSMSASAVAEKVELGPWVGMPQLLFTDKEVLSYDDQAGTLSLRMKGRFQQKPFDTTFHLEGFTHPYASIYLGSILASGDYLIFDEAIKTNLSLAKFIEKANAKKGVGFVRFQFQLSNGETLSMGEDGACFLTPQLSQKGNDVKIVAHYGLNYKKFDGSTKTVTAENRQTKVVDENHRYFTEKDVYEQISKKLKSDVNFIKVDSGKFASSFYAQTMVLNQGSSLFDLTAIQEYQEVYREKGADEHLAIAGIAAGIYNLRMDGITADDYEGSLTVNFYISNSAVVSMGGGAISEISTPEKITASGFRKLQEKGKTLEESVRMLLTLTLMPDGDESAAQSAWFNHTIDTAHLIRENSAVNPNYSNWFLTDKNILRKGNSGKFYLLAGGEDYSVATWPGFSSYFCYKSSKGNILIRQLSLSKKSSSNLLLLKAQFMGKDETIDFSISATR